MSVRPKNDAIPMKGLSVLDAELLDRLFTEAAKKKLMKEIHEWIIYTAPPEVLEIYRGYLDAQQADIKIDE